MKSRREMTRKNVIVREHSRVAIMPLGGSSRRRNKWDKLGRCEIQLVIHKSVRAFIDKLVGRHVVLDETNKVAVSGISAHSHRYDLTRCDS